jgi:hypothetical protein
MWEICADTEEKVRLGGIDNNQLQSIAEWAFSEQKVRTLVLGNAVESLAAAVVSTCMRARLAIVDCSKRTYKSLNDTDSSAHGLALYFG